MSRDRDAFPTNMKTDYNYNLMAHSLSARNGYPQLRTTRAVPRDYQWLTGPIPASIFVGVKSLPANKVQSRYPEISIVGDGPSIRAVSQVLPVDLVHAVDRYSISFSLTEQATRYVLLIIGLLKLRRQV